MAIQYNLQGNCTADTTGTGVDSCIKQYGDFDGIDLKAKGFSLDVAVDSLPTKTEYKESIQALTTYPLNDINDFTQDTPDNEISTSSKGIETDIRQARPKFGFMWDEGGCWNGSVYDKRGKDRWDLIFKFEKGVLYARDIGNTELKGFDNGKFSVGSFKTQQGTDPETTTVNIQLLDADEWNARQVFYTWEQLGYDMRKVNGVLNAKLTYPSDPIAGTTFSVKVVSTCNESVPILGLDDANEWALGGVQTSATVISAVVYNVTAQEYDITVDTALIVTDTIQPSLADDLGGFDVAENANGDLYKGTTPLFEIIA